MDCPFVIALRYSLTFIYNERQVEGNNDMLPYHMETLQKTPSKKMVLTFPPKSVIPTRLNIRIAKSFLQLTDTQPSVNYIYIRLTEIS